MDINKNSRIIDITVEDLKVLIREILRSSDIISNTQTDDIGGINMAQEVTKLSKKTIYQLTSTRKIPFFKKGKLLYFSRSDLEKWIRSGKQLLTDDFVDVAGKYIQVK